MVGAGKIVFLEEIENDGEAYVGKSLRVVGSIEKFDVRSKMVLLSQLCPSKIKKVFLRINTSSLDPQAINSGGFRKGSLFMFIGELKSQIIEVKDKNTNSELKPEKVLMARVGRNSDGLDLHLYRKAVLARRAFLAEETKV